MHVLSLALLVAAAQTAPSEEPKAPAAPVPVSSPDAAPAPPSPPTAPAGPAATPLPAATSSAAPAAPAAALSPAAVEKMGQGDRAFLDRDYRGALFAYMDAAYLAAASAAPHVKLARAYLALRYPARAIEQAEKALALDPGNAEARRLVDEARSATAAAAPPAPPAVKPPAPASSARVFRFVPDADAAPEPARASAAPAAAVPQPQGATAAQRYRQGLDHMRDRELEKAIAAFSDAVAIDPRLAVAYAARASARFGLGAYPEAADDYRRAIDLDAGLATPLYGLAECQRVLGRTKEAAELYRQYAESRAPDARDDLRALAAKRAQELR